MNNIPGASDEIRALLTSGEFQVELAQLQARSLLKEVTGRIPEYNWSYIPHRITRNIALATSEVQYLAENQPESIKDIGLILARIWEAIWKLDEFSQAQTALINSAVNYELAGYQANAAYLSRFLRETAPQGSLVNIIAVFLQRRLIQLRHLASIAQDEPEAPHKWDASLYDSLLLAVAARSLENMCLYLLNGKNEHYTEARNFIARAIETSKALNLVEQSNLLYGISSLFSIIKQRSTWTLLGGKALITPLWNRYLKLLARGVDSNIYTGRSISELWPSQILALNNGLLSTNDNKIIKMPTSAGKTRVAELAIVDSLINSPNTKCVYVAPYRALVSELQSSFFNLLNDLGFRVSKILGSYEYDEFEMTLFKETDLLVTTPEKLDLVLRVHPEFLENARLFIFDEIQIVGDQTRGIKTELLLTKLKMRFDGARFLFLSAVVPNQTLEDFADWMNASRHNGVINSEWRPSIQRYAAFQWMPNKSGVLRYAQENPDDIIQKFVSGVIAEEEITFVNPETGRENRRRFPDVTNKAQTAVELAYKFAELGPVLIFCSQGPYLEAVAKAFLDKFRFENTGKSNIPGYFSESLAKRSYLLSHEWLGEHYFSELIKNGIGIHYGGIPDDLRSAVEEDFRENKLRVLIATNTVGQGVNFPVKTVIFHSCWRHEDSQYISARDYWNIAGRAGRAGKETEGFVIHIVNTYSDRKRVEYYLEKKSDVEPIESILYQRLQDLTNQKITAEDLLQEIDAEVLGLLLEKEDAQTIEQMVEELVDNSFATIRAKRGEVSLDPLKQIIAHYASMLSEQIGDKERVAAYAALGISSTSCKLLDDYISSNSEQVKDLLTNWDIQDLERAIDLVLPVLTTLPEMQPFREFGGNHRELLISWVSGFEISRIQQQFGAISNSPESLGKFIDDYFRYRLPWGIAGFINLATKILRVEINDLGDFAKYLPSMVKYGLPNYYSCWIKTLGIPYRSVSIQMAESFSKQVEARNHNGLLDWISDLSSGMLIEEYHLEGPVLEDVSRSLFLNSKNDLIKFGQIKNIFPIDFEVAVSKHFSSNITARRLSPGTTLTLVRDYANLIDRNAIRLELNKIAIGYVPRKIAQLLAPEIDAGSNFVSILTEVSEGKNYVVSVNLV